MCSGTGIALFVYNRPYHMQKVLEGLKANNISNLYIFSDGSKNEKDSEEVKEVRNLIKEIEWCETEVHVSFHNKGLAVSIVDGVNYILNKHDRVIVLEDDCVPSIDFVSFMEKCFDEYENIERVMSVSGFSLPIKIPGDYQYDIYFSRRFCSYGWGTWKRAWKYFRIDETFIHQIEKSRSFRRRVVGAGEDLIPILKKQLKEKIDSWAIFWFLSIIKRDGLCIYSATPRIKNVGFDGSGVHSKSRTTFDVDLSENYNQNLSFPNGIELNVRIIREIKRFYSFPFKEKFNRKVKKSLKFIRLYKFLKTIKSKISGVGNENSSS